MRFGRYHLDRVENNLTREKAQTMIDGGYMPVAASQVHVDMGRRQGEIC